MPGITSRFALVNQWPMSTVSGLQVYSISTPGNAERTLNIFELARRSARKATSAYYQKNSLKIGVYIASGSRHLLDQAIDTLLTNIQATEADIVVPMSGGVRRYTATYAGMQINKTKGGFIDATLIFECSDSFGYDTNYTVLMPATNFTAASRTDQYTQLGSAPTQAPFFQVKVTAVTGGTSASITIGNQNTGQAATITRTWSVNDLLQIDCANESVKVNGVDVAFTGAIPKFAPGLQTFTYNDTFTTRTFNYFVYVYNRFN